MLYGEPESALEQLQLQDGDGGLFPQLDGASTQRLIVVANRLPVSAYKDRSGRWQLQVGAFFTSWAVIRLGFLYSPASLGRVKMALARASR